MKNITKLFVLILIFGNHVVAQKPTQQWINVLNTTSSSNDLFKGGTSRIPVSINSKGTKIALAYNVDNLAAMSILKSTNGDVEVVNKSSINSDSKSIIFDNSDNAIFLSISNSVGTNWDAIIKKFNALSGNIDFDKTINNYSDDNAQTILNSGNGYLMNTINRNATDGKLSHSIYKFDDSGVVQWNSTIADYDWYYGYEGKVTKDVNDNTILTGKRHLSANPNNYDIVIRKLNSTGVQQWQIYYDYNNQLDVICNRSVITDLNGDVYFVDANSNNWSGTTYRLVKLSAKDGSIIYQQAIGTSGVSDLLINKDGNLIINAGNEIRSYNPVNGQLNWNVAITEINSINLDKSGNIYVASKGGINILDANGKILNTSNVAMSAFTTNHLYVVPNDLGNEFYVFGYRTANNINKIFVSKFSTGAPQSTLSSTKVFVDAPASVKQNDTLELSISTEALNTVDNVIAYQTDFTYDTTRFAYIGSNLVGTLNSAGSVDINTSKKGLLKVGYMSQTALNGAGNLVKLKFKANNTVGQGIFGLSNFLYNTTAITSLKNDTVNTIDGIAPTGKISYSGNPVRKGDSLLITVKYSEKMAIAPVPQLNLSGQNTLANANLTKVNDTTYTYWWVVEKGNGLVNVTLASGKDLAGNNIVATPTQNASFTVLPTLFGDIDTNKFIQAYDGALALQYSVGLNPLPTMDPLPWSNWRIAVANVDTVGNITANDASLILQKSIDKIASFPADAKKRGDAPVANITVTQEANQLVFRATGTLYAFNVFMKDNFNAFGQPEVKDKNAMIATNITSTTYNVGLASTTPFTENEPFLVIPMVTNENVQGTMDIVANAQEKALAYGTAASIATIQNDAMVVYPNPTKDLVTIKNAQGKTLRIVDFQGRLVNTQIVTSNAHDVSLKAIATKGEYIFQLIGENNETIATQKVVMQ